MRGKTWNTRGGWLVGLLGIAAFLDGSRVYADGPSSFLNKKQEDKQKNRWSLQDWLDTRDKMKVQDLWLALHSPSPYEFFLSGAYRTGLGASNGTFVNGGRVRISGGAFASIAGIEASYDTPGDSSEFRYAGLVDLRVFGFHDQGTNITLQGGLRQVIGWSDDYRSAIGGLRATFCITRFFGIGGLFHHYFASTPTLSGISYSGNRFEGTGFIDYSFVRVFGTYFSEPEDQSGPNGVNSINRTGGQFGIQLYF